MKVSIANPCIDKIFKIAMTRPNVARGFLNAILNLEGDQEIVEVSFPNKDLPSSDPTSSAGYDFTVDVRCSTKDGKHFLIEMQNDFRSDYQLKALIEHSRMIGRLDIENDGTENAKKEFWKNIDGLYTIVITNKFFSPQSFKKRFNQESVMEPGLVNVYELRHTEHLQRRYGDTPNQLILLMLANLCDKKLEELSKIERWSYLLYDETLRSGIKKIVITKEISDVGSLVGGDDAIREFIQSVDVQNLEQDMWRTLATRIDYNNGALEDIIDKAKKESKEQGIAEGIEKGIEKGETKGKLETAKNMKEDGLSINTISKWTGLSVDDLKILYK